MNYWDNLVNNSDYRIRVTQAESTYMPSQARSMVSVFRLYERQHCAGSSVLVSDFPPLKIHFSSLSHERTSQVRKTVERKNKWKLSFCSFCRAFCAAGPWCDGCFCLHKAFTSAEMAILGVGLPVGR